MRLRGLGDLGLVVDEGNQALAVQGILEHGLPIVPSGIVYGRNLLFLYTQALFGAGLGLDEFSLRLPAALFGTGSIVATFALGRTLFDARVGLLAAALVGLSLWEIAFSRYARPYTAFQCLYVLALLAFFRGFLRHERAWQPVFAGLALLLLATHELSLALATCFAIPLLRTDEPLGARIRPVWGVPVLALAWVGYQRGAEALLQSLAPPHGLAHVDVAGVAAAAARPWWGLPGIHLPDVSPLRGLWTAEPMQATALTAVLLIGGAWSARRLLRTAPQRIPLVLLAVAAAALHQFALAGLLLAGDLVLFGRRSGLLSRALAPALAAIGLGMVFWVVRLASTAEAADGKAVVLALFGYPNVLQHFLFWLATGWPVVLVGFAGGCAALAWSGLRGTPSPVPIFVLSAVGLPVVAASFFRSFFEARYVFHLFPLVVIVFAWAALRLGDALAARLPFPPLRAAAALLVVLAALALSQDASPAAAWAFGDRTYAAPLDPHRSVISWQPYAGFHQDHETPSAFVRERRRPGDRVIVMGPPHALGIYTFYLGPVDASVGRAGDDSYYRRRGRATVAWVTGSRILRGPEALARALEPNGARTFLLGDTVLLQEGNDYYGRAIRELVAPLAATPDHLGDDGRTFVVEIPP